MPSAVVSLRLPPLERSRGAPSDARAGRAFPPSTRSHPLVARRTFHVSLFEIDAVIAIARHCRSISLVIRRSSLTRFLISRASDSLRGAFAPARSSRSSLSTPSATSKHRRRETAYKSSRLAMTIDASDDASASGARVHDAHAHRHAASHDASRAPSLERAASRLGRGRVRTWRARERLRTAQRTRASWDLTSRRPSARI